MRRSLAAAALSVVAIAMPASAAQQVPPPPRCDIFQNCVCSLVSSAVYRVTGEYPFYCV